MKPRVFVLGDSLAGLVTAWRLCTADFQVTVLKTHGHSDAATSAFSLPEQTQSLDSPQHESVEYFCAGPATPLVCYGAHKQTDALLQDLNISKHESSWRPVSLEFKTPSSPPVRFPNTPLPAPWHTVLGILNFSALPYSLRWHLLNFVEKVWEGVAILPNSLDLESAESWLTSIGQPLPVHKTVWNPLCRFLLRTDLAHTHAGSFVTMLTRVFFQSRQHRPQIAQIPNLPTRLEEALTEQLKKRGTTIVCRQFVEYLQVGPEHVTGVCLSNGSLHTADWYVSGLLPTTLSSLLPERLLARYSSFQQMSQTTFAPTITFHLELDLKIKKPRLLLLDAPFSWTLCRPTLLSKSLGSLLSCVSTNDATFLSLPDKEIKACAIETLQELFSDQTCLASERPFRYHIARQPFGFVPHPLGTKPYPLSNQTPLRNLLLAGSWTDTGAITEIESTIVSGELCAQAIINQNHERD